jgi:uncharacterized membrane protein
MNYNVDFDDGAVCATCGMDAERCYRKIGTKRWQCPRCFMIIYGKLMAVT